MVDTILAMQPRLATLPGSTTPDQQVAAIAASILDRLPPILSMAEAGPGVFQRTPAGQLNSLAVVLGQEMERFNSLGQVMSSTLQELQKALQGLVVMSGDLELMSTSLLNSQVSSVTAVVYDLHKHARCLQMSHLTRVHYVCLLRAAVRLQSRWTQSRCVAEQADSHHNVPATCA